MEIIDRKELEKWYKVYALYKATPYIGFIEEFLDELEPQSYAIWKKLSQLSYDYEFKKYYTLEDALQLAKEFLLTLGDAQAKFLDDGIKNGSIEIYDVTDEYDIKNNIFNGRFIGPYYSKQEIEYEDYKNLFKLISLPLRHNIDDVYSLIHELAHASNADVKYDSSDWRVLTESASITYEFILMDYLIQNDICNEDNLKPVAYRMIDFFKKARDLAQGLTIFRKIKENIDSFKEIQLYDTSSAKDKDDKERLIKEQREDIAGNFKTLRKTLEYYLGTLIAIINYKRFKEGKLDYKTFEKYCDALKENEQLESLDILFDRVPSIEEINEAIDMILEVIAKVKIKNR